MSSRMNGGSGTSMPGCIPNSFVEDHSPVFLAQKISNGLKPLPPLKFPTLYQLAGAQITEPDRQKRDGLFQQLIGEPLLLFQSLLDDPEMYETGVSELLQDLINKRRTLAELDHSEQELLNRAAIDFATAKRPAPTPVPTTAAPRGIPAAARMAMSEPELEHREQGRPMMVIDVPKSVSTFWWRKKSS